MKKRMIKAPIMAKSDSNSWLFIRIIRDTYPLKRANVKIFSIKIFANILTMGGVLSNFFSHSTSCAKVSPI
jgi:hypothetical protein